MNSEFWVIQPLSGQHERSLFDCGVEAMNRFLKEYAVQNAKKDIAKTFVVVSAAEPARIGGYHTLTLHSLTFEELPNEKHLPHYPIPVVHLGRLEVDTRFQGQGLGKRLLFDALYRSQNIAEQVGCYAVEVVALDTKAADFYAHYGFQALSHDPLHLYLTIKSIRQLNI